ncbi:methionine ABC transporter substrate-binding protein [Bacillus canaveralius]|uniref:Methionine ABC transporter substrate-binding protein n=1 Tax=Bacillus canaveralius TaxID=1403243 RepID=A0A2N5GSM5_9BACI|nr:MetQ/NlpA family ABC transporter substrate-binding protein [Bacillus canaveralius]PLR86769.1 methionine ABC transporter substrate-binding protein [Bacillus canaveralius]PLR92770.1 methionine ABC transporter substrate-binding protein [Bacillus canaveralius]RSK54633.1 methionine ABC transporter substrate-binding protein [Bacillus canaveralius]
MKKLIITVLLGMVLILAACGNESKTNSAAEDKKEINVGFGVGTYEDQFRKGILPILEEKGYKVNIKTFSQNMQVNPAMQEGSIDASVFQSTAYMEGINEEKNMDMTGIAFIPSAPQGLYSKKHTSLDEVKDGTTVALPNDPVNQERAVRILEELGWVKVKSDAGITDFNLNSVEPDQYEIKFEVLDPAQILVSLEDVDYGVVNGNYIANAGKKITDALKIENTPKQHRNIVSINKKDKDTQWAKDLKAAYESSEFEEYINSESKYDGFILPEAWKNN